jgi:phage N-6-adenine-methyltransferase
MSFAGIAPKNHIKQVRARRSNLQLFGDPTDGVDDRRTPRSLFDPLHARYGFTIDAAASSENALLPRFFDREMDGLRSSWDGETVWCNPPYSDIPAWVRKATFQGGTGGAHGVVMLLPADRTEQPWWQDFIEPVRDRGLGVTTEFIRRRVKFGLPPGHPEADKGLARGKSGGGYRYPPFGCVLLRLGACADVRLT